MDLYDVRCTLDFQPLTGPFAHRFELILAHNLHRFQQIAAAQALRIQLVLRWSQRNDQKRNGQKTDDRCHVWRWWWFGLDWLLCIGEWLPALCDCGTPGHPLLYLRIESTRPLGFARVGRTDADPQRTTTTRTQQFHGPHSAHDWIWIFRDRNRMRACTWVRYVS